jgi:hypothetical protein
LGIEPDSAESGRPDLSFIRALLLDLDGVITRTATIHAAAWRRLLDDFMQRWGRQNDLPAVVVARVRPSCPLSLGSAPSCR